MLPLRSCSNLYRIEMRHMRTVTIRCCANAFKQASSRLSGDLQGSHSWQASALQQKKKDHSIVSKISFLIQTQHTDEQRKTVTGAGIRRPLLLTCDPVLPKQCFPLATPKTPWLGHFFWGLSLIYRLLRLGCIRIALWPDCRTPLHWGGLI